MASPDYSVLALRYCLSVRSGFDKLRTVLVLPPGFASAAEATRTFSKLLYLPAHEGMDEQDVERLAKAIAEFKQRQTSQAAGSLKMS